MELEEIGFYTLSDDRARNTSVNSPLWRCELILTDKCNFRCPYCRGLRNDCKGAFPLSRAIRLIDYWTDEGLKNIRFSGGEPMLYPHLNRLVKRCKKRGVERIAISTNGSFSIDRYLRLVEDGVDDISISLDACCSQIGDKMSGGISGSWRKVVDNIRELSKHVYVTVGMVFTEENVDDCVKSVEFADSLGVSDIRVIPSAQYNRALNKLTNIDINILKKYPILRYRITEMFNGEHVRGMQSYDCRRCWLVLDDMAVAGKWHFPCIIYLREQGNPIGKISNNIRAERKAWSESHDCYADPICRNNCLDVCSHYNNRAELLKIAPTVQQ